MTKTEVDAYKKQAKAEAEEKERLDKIETEKAIEQKAKEMTEAAVRSEIEAFNAKPYKRAMLDTGATVSYTSDWSNGRKNPELYSSVGWHNDKEKRTLWHVQSVTMAKPHYVNKLSL